VKYLPELLHKSAAETGTDDIRTRVHVQVESDLIEETEAEGEHQMVH
jgi:hypothetical protein